METDLIHIFGVTYDLISMKYDIVENSNYIDELLVHEWNIWIDRVHNVDSILGGSIFDYENPLSRFQFIPFISMFDGIFIVEGGDIDEEAS